MFTNTVNPERPLASSELVFLNGEQFAEKVRLGNIDLLHLDQKVSLNQLVLAILATAILACEEVEAFHLEIRERKTMLGLRKVKELFAVPAKSRVSLPENSLEATFSNLATQLAPEDNNDIMTIVYSWLGGDVSSPWNTAVEMLEDGMVKRGLLEATQQTKLKVFTITQYSLPESTARLAIGQAIGTVKALLDNCARNRPEVWKLLESSIKKAVNSRTESSDMDFD